MAYYKVPQNVEAEDKILGPFSFRQFIYLIVAALGCALAWGFYVIFPPLVVIPIPIILFFLVLALPIKKDQPMEIYLSAIVSFYLKPRRRLWIPDGNNHSIEITIPKTNEQQLTKNLSEDEAARRIKYLAQIVDTKGWAVRGLAGFPSNPAINDNVYGESTQINDMLDNNNPTAISLNQKLEASNDQIRKNLTDNLKKQLKETKATDSEPVLEYNPYPESIHQSILNPDTDDKKNNHKVQKADNSVENKNAKSTKQPPVSADIMNLVDNSSGLTVSTIAHEADRLKNKNNDNKEEVFISLH